MLALLEQQGYKITENPEEADAIIINTCGFINSAKEESIDSILDAVQLKKKGKIKKLVVCGCLSERYREEVIKEIPEIDAIFGVNDYGNICGFIDQIFRRRISPAFQILINRNAMFLEKLLLGHVGLISRLQRMQ